MMWGGNESIPTLGQMPKLFDILERLKLAWLHMLNRLCTHLGALWFHCEHPREFARSLLQVPMVLYEVWVVE